MTQIRWTEEAVQALEALSARDLAEILERLDLFEQFPEMYPRRQRGRFAGLRYVVVDKRWLMYYRALSREGVLILAIVPALARSEG